jgi:[acyl-carrier-protein] S-malonyltransferase
MIAYIFPGQGSQHAGMGKELADESAIAEQVFRAVDQALDFSLSGLMFGEDAAALLPTEVAQPAIFTHSLAAFAALRKRHEAGPVMVAGHSLGEYSALVAAGCMELEEAARLVRTRGELMGAAGAQVGGAMAAVVNMDADAVEALVCDAAGGKALAVANYNTPGQIVISGDADAVAAARDLAKQRGGKAIPLKVSGAFHSPLMQPAADALRPHLDAAALCDAEVPLVSNVDATPRQDAAGIREALAAQVTGSVRWEQSVRCMIAAGVDTFIELGPGNVLTKMMPRIDGSVRAFSVSTLADIYSVMEAIA